MRNLQQLANEIIDGRRLGAEEALEVYNAPSATELYEAADKVRLALCGNTFETCSIINARSGRCPEDCKWCSQSHKHKTGIDIYPLVSAEDALRLARRNQAAGVRRFSLVTSGRSMSDPEIEKVCAIYDMLRTETPNLELCASMGLLSLPQLQRLRNAGVTRYHCNLETAPSFFKTLCTTHTSADKLQTIHWARAVGMSVCSGGIIGMGESREHRVELAVCLREEARAVSIPINILSPIKGTALENQPPLCHEEILRTMAMFRLVNPTAAIRFAGGRIGIKNSESLALAAGMNGSIVGDMLTTSGVKSIEDDLECFKAAGFCV